MKLKLDAQGNVVTKEVNGQKLPVYVHDDGREIEFDAAGAMTKIATLNGEAKDHRTAKEAAEAKLAAFEGIEDPAAAKKALETVKTFTGKQALTIEEIELKVKERVTGAVQATEDKYKPIVESEAKLKDELYNEKIGGSFARSKFIAEKLAVPAGMIQATFGKQFTVVNGKVVAKDANGKEILSKAKPGELADFDEALETIVGGYEHKAAILKGIGASGGGSHGGGGGGSGGVDLSSLSPQARMTAHRESQGKT